MSGLCGIFVPGGTFPGAEFVRAMTAALGDGRGGDATATAPEVGVGVRAGRLHVTGIAERRVNDSPVILAFHGDVFASGDRKTDGARVVEPLLDLVVERGIEALARASGDSSFAFWDGRDRTLRLVTDRFHIHPLLYCEEKGVILFASRMGSLLASPLFSDRALDTQAVLDTVDSSVVHCPDTIFTRVRKIPPGHVLTCRRGGMDVSPWWRPDYIHKRPGDERKLAAEVRAALSSSVADRLAVDGPPEKVGTFLSGGIDSTTVTGLVTRLGGRPTDSFSIGFDEKSYDEMRYARIAARAFGARHHEYYVTPADGADCLNRIVEAFDSPFGNASAIATYFCARRALDAGIPTLYAGDGGDELFAGNSRYAAQRLFDYYYRVPAAARSVLKPVVGALAGGLRLAPFRKAASYIRRAEVPYPDRLLTYGLLNLMPMDELLTPDFRASLGGRHPYDLIARLYREAPAESELDRQLYIDLYVTLADTDIPKVERMCDAAGLRVRFPFLDSRVVDLANAIPTAILMRGLRLRSFFKRACADLLPLEIRRKTKHGFGVPISDWLLHDPGLHETMRDLVLSPRSRQRGFFQGSALERIVERHATGDMFFYGRILWNLMVLEQWLRTWVDRPVAAPKGRPVTGA